MTTTGAAPLHGCRVAVTREAPGRLGRLLVERGAEVVHVPLIEVVDADDGGAALRRALADPDTFDWVLVTSPAGVDRVAGALADPRSASGFRIGCVGSATAERVEELLGRPADLVSERQLAAALAERFVAEHPTRQRVVVAQADRAAPTLVDTLEAAGHRVIAIVAYRTLARRPSAGDLERLRTVDAVLFASGSAAITWSQTVEPPGWTPDVVVTIGPSTAEAAAHAGLKVSGVAADHSVPGLVAELEFVWRSRRRRVRAADPMA